MAEPHPGDARFENALGARSRAAREAAGLQRDREGGAAHRPRAVAPQCGLDRDHLGMGPADGAGAPPTQDPIAAKHHRAHRRIRKGVSDHIQLFWEYW